MRRGHHFRQYRGQTLPKQKLIQPFQTERSQAGSVTSFYDLRPIDSSRQVLLSRSRQYVVNKSMATERPQRSSMAIRIAQEIVSLGAVIHGDDIAAIK